MYLPDEAEMWLILLILFYGSRMEKSPVGLTQ